MTLKNSLVIGNTSQLSLFFPKDYIKISSRNIPNNIYDQSWDSVYICFAEQKTYNSVDKNFMDINYNYTIEVISRLNANKIIFYSTAELWNNSKGAINPTIPYNYHYSDYIYSKHKISDYLKQSKLNVKIVYPFNFNSINRKPPFLFGKIFESIAYNKKICIGDTYYYRDITHPKFIVARSLNAENDLVLGGGKLIFVNSFIKKLYEMFNMNYKDFVEEDLSNKSFYRNNEFYSDQNIIFSETDLLNILYFEINQFKSNQ